MRFQIRLRFIELLILFFSLVVLIEAQSQQPFEMREGVVVDPVNKQAYVMNPKGGIDAIDLSRGTSLWHTDRAAKPLALIGDRLIAQVEPKQGDNTLEVAVLNVKNQGERIGGSSNKLPAEVKVTVDDTLKTTFHTSARVSAGNVYLFWQHMVQPKSPAAEEEPARGQKLLKESSTANDGILRINSSGEILSVSRRQVPAVVVRRPPDLAGKERLPGISGPQFLSADDKNVQSPQRIADDTVWNKYRWTIYERATSKRIGEIRNFQSQAPFFVFDTQIVLQTAPFSLNTEKEQVDEPLKIRALSLQTGQEVWSWEIRDTAYRGPTPP
jgi:hypothetical protein